MLGEQNELTQELASQGMSIVYELGNESMKSNLVNALVTTLTGSGKRKRAVKVKYKSFCCWSSPYLIAQTFGSNGNITCIRAHLTKRSCVRIY